MRRFTFVLIVFLSAILLYFLFRRRETFTDIPPPFSPLSSAESTQLYNYINKYLIPGYTFIRPKLVSRPEFQTLDPLVATGLEIFKSPEFKTTFSQNVDQAPKEIVSALFPIITLVLNTLFAYGGYKRRLAPFQFNPRKPFRFSSSSLLPAGTPMRTADYTKIDNYLENIISNLRDAKEKLGDVSENINEEENFETFNLGTEPENTPEPSIEKTINEMIADINKVLPTKNKVEDILKPFLQQQNINPDILNFIPREDVEVIIQRLISQVVNPALQFHEIPLKFNTFSFRTA